MITKINSESELCDLFNDCPHEAFKYHCDDVQFPIIVFVKERIITQWFDNEDYTYYYFCPQKFGNIRKKNKFKINCQMLIFDNITNIYEIICGTPNNKLSVSTLSMFYGTSINELILDNAKILIFMNAINDNNSNIMMLNYDIINYILSFYGPFSLLKK